MNRVIHANRSVMANDHVAANTYRIRLHAPDLAHAIRPGQFVMLRIPDVTDPLLGRPFALYDTVLDARGKPIAVDIVYLVIGKVTGILAGLRPGDKVEVWGPLGNGFPMLSDVDHVGLVAGGIGQTPFLAYVRELLGGRGYAGNVPREGAKRVSLYYGVRTADLAAGVEDFRAAGAGVHLATDDGTLGFHGFVTELLQQSALPLHLIGCGPEPMLRALVQLACRWSLPCHVSLESPMACGIGICFSCVTPVQTPEGIDYRRICFEGPVFDAACLAWQ